MRMALLLACAGAALAPSSGARADATVPAVAPLGCEVLAGMRQAVRHYCADTEDAATCQNRRSVIKALRHCCSALEGVTPTVTAAGVVAALRLYAGVCGHPPEDPHPLLVYVSFGRRGAVWSVVSWETECVCPH
jgi:hypothetical protein